MMAFKYIHTIVIAKISDRGRSLVWLAIALKTLKSKKKKEVFSQNTYIICRKNQHSKKQQKSSIRISRKMCQRAFECLYCSLKGRALCCTASQAHPWHTGSLIEFSPRHYQWLTEWHFIPLITLAYPGISDWRKS